MSDPLHARPYVSTVSPNSRGFIPSCSYVGHVRLRFVSIVRLFAFSHEPCNRNYSDLRSWRNVPLRLSSRKFGANRRLRRPHFPYPRFFMNLSGNIWSRQGQHSRKLQRNQEPSPVIMVSMVSEIMMWIPSLSSTRTGTQLNTGEWDVSGR